MLGLFASVSYPRLTAALLVDKYQCMCLLVAVGAHAPKKSSPKVVFASRATAFDLLGRFVPALKEYKRGWVLGLCVFAALSSANCKQDVHDRVSVSQQDCVVCHLDDYEGAQNPVHVDVFPTTCGDCHDTQDWHETSAGVHPEERFSITQVPHSVVQCTQCHDEERGAYTNGQNTDCVGCHLGVHARALTDPSHESVPGYPTETTSVNFCLTCHADGRR